MSINDSWMPLYLGDYLADTMHLSFAQHGIYLLLLMHYWRNGPLPDDDAQLASIVKADAKAWRSVGNVVRRFFTSVDGKLHQKRMDHERRRWSDISDKRRAAGKAGADAKWQANGKPPNTPDGKPMANAMAIAEQTPEICHDFANTPVPVPLPLSKNINKLTLGEVCARARPEPGDAKAAQNEPPADPERISAAIAELENALKMRAYPPGRPPIRDAQDQIEAIAEPRRPRARHLAGDQLAVARRLGKTG